MSCKNKQGHQCEDYFIEMPKKKQNYLSVYLHFSLHRFKGVVYLIDKRKQVESSHFLSMLSLTSVLCVHGGTND